MKDNDTNDKGKLIKLENIAKRSADTNTEEMKEGKVIPLFREDELSEIILNINIEGGDNKVIDIERALREEIGRVKKVYQAIERYAFTINGRLYGKKGDAETNGGLYEIVEDAKNRQMEYDAELSKHTEIYEKVVALKKSCVKEAESLSYQHIEHITRFMMKYRGLAKAEVDLEEGRTRLIIKLVDEERHIKMISEVISKLETSRPKLKKHLVALNGYLDFLARINFDRESSCTMFNDTRDYVKSIREQYISSSNRTANY